MTKWYVVTASGLPVFDGTKRQCNAYIKQAIVKGSKPGFLTIVPARTVEE